MNGPISRLLDPSRIILNVQSTRRAAALQEVAQRLRSHPDVTDFDGFYRDLLARDQLDTTCLGHGLALPHARTDHVRTIVMVVGRSERGILFDHDQEDVRLMLMLATPRSKPGDYLQVLGALCKLLKDDANIEALLAAASPEDFIHAVVAAEEKRLVAVNADRSNVPLPA
jgi:mannitol/fructose-specific phosphotransferase system IIA component (Ntr-type)